MINLANKEQMTLYGIIGLLLTTVIGSGIWKDPLKWTNLSGFFGIFAIILVWILILSIGLAYSESVSMFPKGGGPYSYVGGAFGKRAGNFVGIAYFAAYLFISALLSFLTANYLLAALSQLDIYSSISFLDWRRDAIILTIIVILVLAFFAVISNPKQLGDFSLIWVAIKILFLLLVAALAILNWDNSNLGSAPSISAFQDTINLIVFALLGFEVVLIFSDETEEAAKTIPKGIVMGLLIILGIYLFVYIASVGILELGTLPAGTDLIDLIAGKANLDSYLVNLFVAFSAAGTAFAVLATCIHQLRVMARDNSIPAEFNKKKFNVHLFNYVFVVILVSIIAGFMIENLKTNDYSIDHYAAVGIGLVLIASALPAGIVALYTRIKLPALDRPFKSPYYFIVFPLAILLSSYLIYLNYFNDYEVFEPAAIFSGILLVLILVITLIFGTILKLEKTDDW